jgi:hypothetical protein
MCADSSKLELGFMVSLGSLREVLKGVSIDGRRWRIDSDPQELMPALQHSTQDTNTCLLNA